MEAYGGASGLLHPQDPGLESGDQGVRSEPSWTELRVDSAGFLSRRPVSRVSRTAVSVCTFSEDGRARQTRLSQEKGGGV